jgi:hypothetical protein
MPIEVDEVLGRFHDSDWSVRLVKGVCSTVPFAPHFEAWYSMVEGLKALDPNARRRVLERAAEISRTPQVQRALWMVTSLDTADTGISAFSGLKAAYGMYKAQDRGERLQALETDTQQAVDAVLKGLAMAFVVQNLFPGSISEKIAAFRNNTAGQAWIFYYAAIEVGLPFTDNALQGGGALLQGLWEKYGPDQTAKIAAVASEEEAAAAVGTLQQLMAPIGQMASMAAQNIGPIASAVTGYLGTAVEVGDKVAGMAATGADLLHVYRFLGARLVGEACLRQALAEEVVAASAVEQIPALVEVKYTRSAQDLPDAPRRRGGCFLGLWVVLLAIGAGSATAAWVIA